MFQITMPRLSDTMEEGVISSWLKQPGDQVESGEAIVEIETDKAIMEFEAYETGVLTNILVPEGERVAIGTPIAEIDDGSDANPAAGAPSQPVKDSEHAAEARGEQSPATSAPSDAAPTASNGAVLPDVSAGAASSQAGHSGNSGDADDSGDTGDGALQLVDGAGAQRPDRLLATPLVRRLARERDIDLTTVAGSGPGGRIVRADLERLMSPGATPSVLESGDGHLAGEAASFEGGLAGSEAATAAGSPSLDMRRGSVEVPLSNIRRVIARRLSSSASTVPHFFVTAVANVEELVVMRTGLNEKLVATGRAKVSINDLLVRACALALRQHPAVNASYVSDDSSTMLLHDRVNVGIAIASDNGLVVPVVEDADQKTVTTIGSESRRFVELAQGRKLTADHMSGGTFTISNLGMFGVEEFTAIINPPEGAILAVGSTTREAVVVNDQVEICHRMRYTLSADHRIIDGALAAQFLQTLTTLLESPWTLLA